MANIRTHYDNLRVARNAPDSVIKAAYKALCQTYHPDKFQGSNAEAERIMKLINASYVVLIDPVKRAEHDAWIQAQETKWKYTPPPTEPEPDSPEADTSLYLWRRYFARYVIDYTISGLVLVMILMVWSATINQSLPNRIIALLDNPELSLAQQIAHWGFISAVFWVILEPICLSIFGTTAGKALFRLRLVSDNIEPSYWGRSIAAWAVGVGFGIPVISGVLMLNAAMKLKKNGQTDWDKWNGFSVEADPISIVRGVSLTALIPLLIVVNAQIGNVWKQTILSQQPIQQAQVVKSVPQATPQAATEDPRCIGDCINGQGKYTYANGETYSGDFKNGIREGQGKYIFVDGSKYVGEFKNGEPAEKTTLLGQTSVKKYSGNQLSLHFKEIEIRSILLILIEFSGEKIIASDDVVGNVAITIDDIPWDQALEMIIQPKGFVSKRIGNFIYVLPINKIDQLEWIKNNQQTTPEDIFQHATDLLNRSQYEESHLLTKTSAELGLVVAQLNLGLMYDKGLGVWNDNQARYWYRKAAEQGNAVAIAALKELTPNAQQPNTQATPQAESSCIGDCINGHGSFTYANGDKYVGDWKNGKREGKGAYTFSNGLVINRVWKDDKEVKDGYYKG